MSKVEKPTEPEPEPKVSDLPEDIRNNIINSLSGIPRLNVSYSNKAFSQMYWSPEFRFVYLHEAILSNFTNDY